MGVSYFLSSSRTAAPSVLLSFYPLLLPCSPSFSLPFCPSVLRLELRMKRLALDPQGTRNSRPCAFSNTSTSLSYPDFSQEHPESRSFSPPRLSSQFSLSSPLPTRTSHSLPSNFVFLSPPKLQENESSSFCSSSSITPPLSSSSSAGVNPSPSLCAPLNTMKSLDISSFSPSQFAYHARVPVYRMTPQPSPDAHFSASFSYSSQSKRLHRHEKAERKEENQKVRGKKQSRTYDSKKESPKKLEGKRAEHRRGSQEEGSDKDTEILRERIQIMNLISSPLEFEESFGENRDSLKVRKREREIYVGSEHFQPPKSDEESGNRRECSVIRKRGINDEDTPSLPKKTKPNCHSVEMEVSLPSSSYSTSSRITHDPFFCVSNSLFLQYVSILEKDLSAISRLTSGFALRPSDSTDLVPYEDKWTPESLRRLVMAQVSISPQQFLYSFLLS